MNDAQMSYKCEVQSGQDGGVLKLEVYDYIDSWGGICGASAREVIEAINAADEIQRIEVNIHSGGGDLFEALAIYNRLRSHLAPVHVYIDGLAASAASLIAMAGDVITMPQNAWMMIHQPWTVAYGNASDFRDQADFLDRNTEMLIGIYTERSGSPEDQVRAWVTDETWFTGEEALGAGLIDKTTEPTRIAASANLSNFKKTPSALVAALQHKETSPMSKTTATATLAEIKAACPGADADFYLDQVEAGATLQAAQTTYIETLTAKLENRDSQIAELKASHSEELKALEEKHENNVETVKVEFGAEINGLRKAKEYAEAKLGQVEAGVKPEDSPEGADASDTTNRKTSAFNTALRLHRN